MGSRKGEHSSKHAPAGTDGGEDKKLVPLPLLTHHQVSMRECVCMGMLAGTCVHASMGLPLEPDSALILCGGEGTPVLEPRSAKFVLEESEFGRQMEKEMERQGQRAVGRDRLYKIDRPR